MAYIKCKFCGAQMSDKSEACPVCGAPVENLSLPETPIMEQPQEKNMQKKWFFIGGFIVVVIGIIIALWAIYLSRTGMNSSIYKPLSEKEIAKAGEKYDDFNKFYLMLQQMANASLENDTQATDKYGQITYKRITDYMYTIYKGYRVSIPPISRDEFGEVVVPAHENYYDASREQFQEEATDKAKTQYDIQYRDPILSELKRKKQVWETWIENNTPTNYLTITTKYGYREDGLFFIDYRPKFYFEYAELKGTLSDAEIYCTIYDQKGEIFWSQRMDLSKLRYYDGKNGKYLCFSNIDDENFWKTHIVKMEIDNVTHGNNVVTTEGLLDQITETVKEYLENPNYSNESRFIRKYINPKYPIYEYFIEDYVYGLMREKDSICYDFLNTFSEHVWAQDEEMQEDCKDVIESFYTYARKTDKHYYLTRRFAEYIEKDHSGFYARYNFYRDLLPAYESTHTFSGVKNAYRVEFKGSNNDDYIIMKYENDRWKIDNLLINNGKNSQKLAVDYKTTD